MSTKESHTSSMSAKDAVQLRIFRIEDMAEWHFVITVIAIVLVLTSLPYLFAYAITPPDKYFTGIMLSVPDHAQYFSWMRDLSTGNLAANRMTSEPNEPALFNLLWWGVGHIGSISGLDYSALFTLLRLISIVFCMGCAYFFLRIIMLERVQRRLAFVLFAFSGGVGVIWVVLKYIMHTDLALFPLDLDVAEPNTFRIMMAFPHFTLALGLIIAVFSLLLVALRKHQIIFAIAAGIVALILGLQHAYDLLTIYGVLGLFGLLIWVRDRQFPSFLFICICIIGGLSAPPAIYAFWLVKSNPIWRDVLSQFGNARMFTPDPLHLPILLGIPFILALFSVRLRALRSLVDTDMFVLSWFLAHFVLAYLPTDFQVHLLLGWQVPITILASSTLVRYVGPVLSRRMRVQPTAIIAGVLLFSLVSNIYLVAWRFVDLKRYPAGQYISRDELAALNWLGSHSTSDDVVLSDLDFGQFVPMWSDARAFLGHWANTLDFYGKRDMAAHILAGNITNPERLAIVTNYHVSYIVFNSDNELEKADQLEHSADFTPIFKQGRITIYRAHLPSNS